MPRISVRDLIVNSLDECKLCSRTQPAPANLVVSALQLLKRRAAQYSNTNLLQFTRQELNIDIVSSEFIIGEYEITEACEGLVVFVNTVSELESLNPYEYAGKIMLVRENQMCYEAIGAHFSQAGSARSRTDVFEMVPDYEVFNLQEVTAAYIQAQGHEGVNWRKLDFVAYEDFYQYGLGYQIYSVVPLTDKCAKIILKRDYLVSNFKLKLMYDVAFEFDLDTVLNIPKQFVALFSTGLTYDLSVAYPRLSESTTALIKQRLDELEENVRASTSVNKFVGRDLDRASYTYGDFIGGRFLGL